LAAPALIGLLRCCCFMELKCLNWTCAASPPGVPLEHKYNLFDAICLLLSRSLKRELFFKLSLHALNKVQVSVTCSILLLLFREVITVQRMMLNVHIHCGQNAEFFCVNPLNPELNPICYLLALLGAHHFLHVSRIRVKLLTFRRLMSYIYGAPILDVSRSHTTTQHSR